MTISKKAPKQSKEPNEFKGLSKRQRELTGEIKKLKKENARLRKMASRIPESTIDPEEVESIAAIEKQSKIKEAVPIQEACEKCSSTDIAKMPTAYNKKTLCVCRGCMFKWSV